MSTITVPAVRDGVLELALDDLRMLVELETPSSQPAALADAARAIARWLGERLDGVDSRLVEHDGLGPTIVATVPGDGAGRLLMVGHYDTVWPLGTIDEIPFSRVDGVLRGPGVLDMKAGLVTLVHALRAVQASGAPSPAITILLNGDEELGSPASRAVILDEGRAADAALILEPGIGWEIKAERKGSGVLTIEAEGVEAHAGNDPERGVSAIHALAAVVLELAAAADPAAGTTVNVGAIRGGTARNTVAGRASCDVDLRATSRAEMDRIDAVLERLHEVAAPATLRVAGGWTRPPLRRTPENEALLALAQRVAAAVRAPLGERSVGGGSDGNLLSDAEVAVLDGLGASGAGPHARSEHVLEADVLDRIALVAGIVVAVGEAAAAR